jgi:hypothetical protein
VLRWPWKPAIAMSAIVPPTHIANPISTFCLVLNLERPADAL